LAKTGFYIKITEGSKRQFKEGKKVWIKSVSFSPVPG
jgi:hypothetical protein